MSTNQPMDSQQLYATVGEMMAMLKSMKAKQDDQNILLQSVSCQVTVQGERLRKIESDVENVKENISQLSNISSTSSSISQISDPMSKQEIMTFGKQLALGVKSFVKDEMEYLTEAETDHNKELTSRIDQLEKLIKTQVSAVTSSIDDFKTNVDLQTQNLSLVKCRTENLNDKFSRMVNLVLFMNTKLKEEMAGNSISVEDSRKVLSREIKQQSDRMTKLKETVDKYDLDKSLMVIRDDIVTELAPMIDELDAKADEQLNKIGKNHRELRERNHKVIDQILSEAEITRRCVTQSPRPRSPYLCDFHIANFDDQLGSENEVWSRIWYINELNMYMKGDVQFNTNTLDVRLVHGFYPKVLGIELNAGGKIKVKVRALRQDGDGEDWEIGDKTYDCTYKDHDGDTDGWVCGMGKQICKNIPCDEISKTERGLIAYNKLVLRYEITVL